MSEWSAHRTLVLSAEDIDQQLKRIAQEILAKHGDSRLAFVGIHTRGVIVAERVHQLLSDHHAQIDRGTIDIALYRDDLDNLGIIPSIVGSDIPFTVDGAHIILFDDVLFTGRTIRSAIGVLMDYGRPACIELAVLVDRGNRELPIAADYCGHALQTAKEDHIKVCLKGQDGEEGVFQLLQAL